MKSHPVCQLIQSFSAEEKKKMERSLPKNSNSRKLFLLLSRENDDVLRKAYVFKKLTRQPYTKEKDYLLRNELSLLRRKLESFLVTMDSRVSGGWNDFFLAEKFYRRKLVEMAAQKLASARASAMKYEDWKLLLRINRLSNIVQQALIPELSGRIDAARQHIVQHREYIGKLAAIEQAYISYLEGAHIKLQKMEGKEVNQWKNGEMHSSPLIPSSLSRYYALKAEAFATGGIASAKILQEALVHLENAPFDHERLMEWVSVVGQLASEYSIAGDFAYAEKWFRKVLDTDGLESYSGRNFLMLNYTVTLIKQAKYEEALSWIFRLEEVATESFIIERLNAGKVSCYIFLRDTANLKKWLPKNFSEMDADVMHYYRMQYSIYFYLLGDYESAEREVLNLRRDKEILYKEYDQLVDLFVLFYQYIFNRPDKKTAAKATKAFTGFEETAPPQVKALVPALWIVQEWQALSLQTRK